MGSEVSKWDKVMRAALSMPMVKVDRDEFLRRELAPYCQSAALLEKAIATRPAAVVSKEVIDTIAKSCINSHTTKVTAISAAAGLPGGLAMFGTIPADMANYYWHVFVLSQKLAYLYGFPGFSDENGNLSDAASDMLTLFVGVMMGSSAACNAIRAITQSMAKEVPKRLVRMALTKTAIYPIVKQVAKWIGVKMTKDVFAKGVGKAIPILGGIINGGLTLATFRPSAKRLQRELQKQMAVLNAGATSENPNASNGSSFEYAEYTEVHEN